MPGLLDPTVSSALLSHVLPRLEACDLGRLAATCRQLRELTEAAPTIWQQAAQRSLLWHPPFPASMTGVQTALARNAAVNTNLTVGTYRLQELQLVDEGCRDSGAISSDLSTWAGFEEVQNVLHFVP